MNDSNNKVVIRLLETYGSIDHERMDCRYRYYLRNQWGNLVACGTSWANRHNAIMQLHTYLYNRMSKECGVPEIE